MSSTAQSQIWSNLLAFTGGSQCLTLARSKLKISSVHQIYLKQAHLVYKQGQKESYGNI